jgi:hypothetical protein
MIRSRKITVHIATSADGLIGRSDGGVDWLERPRPKANYGMGAFYRLSMELLAKIIGPFEVME